MQFKNLPPKAANTNIKGDSYTNYFYLNTTKAIAKKNLGKNMFYSNIPNS